VPKNGRPPRVKRSKDRGTHEEGRTAAAPPALEPGPAHDHAVVVPAEIRDPAVGADGPLGLPEEDGLALELLRIGRVVREPALHEFVVEDERAVDKLRFLEMLIDVEARHCAAVLLTGCEVELERGC